MHLDPRMTKKLLSAALLLSFSAFPLAATSQENGSAEKTHAATKKGPKENYALIFGTVWDKNNRPVYGVPIKIRRSDKKKPDWERMSDHSGEFAARVPSGKADYVVWADIKAKKGEKRPETVAHVENDERVDVGLHLDR